jgi:hypothetical protein
MLKEATDKFLSRKCPYFFFFCLRVAEPECDIAFPQRQYIAVEDSDAEDIRCQIL